VGYKPALNTHHVIFKLKHMCVCVCVYARVHVCVCLYLYSHSKVTTFCLQAHVLYQEIENQCTEERKVFILSSTKRCMKVVVEVIHSNSEIS
jgi:hypothetical protein